MPNYRRWFVPGGTYFFTVNLLRAGFAPAGRADRCPARRLCRAAKRQPFTTVAICVLPNHLHCIWTLPTDDSRFPRPLATDQGRLFRRLPPSMDIAEGRRLGERGIWQRRFWEHVITDADDLAAHIAYVHGPLTHRLVSEIDDWPFSSWHRWKVEHGGDPICVGGGAFRLRLMQTLRPRPTSVRCI